MTNDYPVGIFSGRAIAGNELQYHRAWGLHLYVQKLANRVSLKETSRLEFYHPELYLLSNYPPGIFRRYRTPWNMRRNLPKDFSATSSNFS